MSNRLTIIKEKLTRLIALDKKHAIFEASVHQYALNKKLPATTLTNFEKKYQLSLPAEYKEFLTQLSNGGAGPFYGLYDFTTAKKEALLNATLKNEKIKDPFSTSFPFSTTVAKKFIKDYAAACEEGDEDLLQDLELPDPVTGVIFLGEYGCGWSFCLVINGEQAGTVWWHGESMKPCFTNGKQWTFYDWYEYWLDESLTELGSKEKRNISAYNETTRRVDLAGHQLKTIPKEIYGATNLKKLVLSNNDFTSFPEKITTFSQLKTLDLSMTPVKKIPAVIGKLMNLKRLLLNYNYITDLPAEFSLLQNLEVLQLFYSYNLKQAPAVLTKLTTLKHLHLSNCYDLTGLPENMGDMQGLETLYLHNNKNLDKLPASITRLINLKELYIDNTAVRSLPDDFDKLKNIETLGIAAEELDLQAAIQQICKLPKLVTLKIIMQAVYPESIAQLSSVRNLVIEQNYKLSNEGHERMPVPEAVCLMPNLERLDMMNNNMASHLPENIGSLTSLKEIEISSTSIKTFPDSIQLLSTLQTISGSLDNSGDKENPYGVLPEEKEKLQRWLPKARINIW